MRAFLFYLFILQLVFSAAAIGQVENPNIGPVVGLPNFNLDALCFQNTDGSSRLDVYIQVPYEVLQFVSIASGFLSRYEVTLNILDKTEVLVFERVWIEEVLLKTFEQTQEKNKFNLSQRSLPLDPGVYTMRIQVRDLESQKATVIGREITIPNFLQQQLLISDIMLVNQVKREAGKSSIAPNVTGNLSDIPDGFSLFFELYNPVKEDSVMMSYKIIDKKENVIYSRQEPAVLTGERTQMIPRIDSSKFQVGNYWIVVQAQTIPHDKESMIYRIEKRRSFIVRWSGLPVSIKDLELAIKQLRYISSEAEYDKFEEAATSEEKERLFQEFWRRRDLSPDTRRNEFMEEYYARVEYANQHFSHYLEGWRTDMGMVFIIFSAPNNVDRHPFDYDAKPYEIWTYYDLNRQLVFVDETGFGDYKLITPIWDLIHRVIKSNPQ
jgi:GWxTD domain-containing protein